MTIKGMNDFIGIVGEIKIGGFSVKVRVVDVKSVYGHVRYQVEPVSGSGSIWTEQKPK